MNNDNNIFGKLTPIKPTENKEETNTQTITVQTNIQENTNPNQNVITPEIIIPEMKEEMTFYSNNQSTPQTSTNDNIVSIEPLPSMNDNNEIVNLNKVGELKLDNSNPFDIGFLNDEIPNDNLEQQENLVENNNISNNNIPVNQEPVIDNQNFNSISINKNNNVISVGKYLLYIILFSIPIVGLIVLIITALDKKNKNLSNFAKAYLIIDLIVVAIVIMCYYRFVCCC